MQIGLFGGTFNPVHLGHVKVAGDIQQRFQLDRLVVIPAALPPHKVVADVVPADDRLEMARLAFEGHRGMTVSDVELKRSGPSYTVDTVRHFKSELGDSGRFFLIIGLDAFLEIQTWMHYEQLFNELPVVVMSRPGAGKPDEEASFRRQLHRHLSADYTFSRDAGCYRHPRMTPVYFVHVSRLDISSTGVREAIRRGKPIDRLVPAAVANYIYQKGLYV